MRSQTDKILEALGFPARDCLWQDSDDGSVTVITDDGVFDVPPDGVLAIPPVAGWHGEEL